MQFSSRFLCCAFLASAALAQVPHKTKNTEKLDLPLQLSREAPLPESARGALALSEAALTVDPGAKAGPDGRVILTYGSGTPTIVCALLNLTEIDLEPGESVAKEGIDLGDSAEFIVAVRHVSRGEGEGGYDYLVVKPKAANIETTMTVGTDRRVYYLRLRSTEDKFLTRVAFAYPAEAAAKALQEQASLLKLQGLTPDLPTALPPPPPPVKPWKYTTKTKGRDLGYLIPLSVGDDGAHTHTHIRFSEQARVRGLPVLQIRDASGPIPANSHWEDNTLIVDALFEDGCLLEGVGRKQQRVCIHNESLPAPLAAKENVHAGK
jgi:type IV secretion system protein VirB9